MSGTFVARLAAALASRVDLRVVTPAAEGPAPPPPDGYRVTRVPYGPRRWQILSHRPGGIPAAFASRSPALLLLPSLVATLAAASFAAARRADLVHANWAAISALSAPLAGRPLVTTLRGSDVARAEVSRPDLWLLRLAMRRSAAVALVGESLARRAAAVAPDLAAELGERMVVIPNGIDPAFSAVGEARSGDGPAAPRLVTVGSLVRGKRVDLILRAFAGLPADARLTVVGGGPRAAEFGALAEELGVAPRVCFTGNVPPADIPQHLADADLFVFASESEGRPNAVLEAMAAGLPVVAPAIPAVRELLDDGTAALYPASAPGELAPLLARLYGDREERRRLARAGRRRAGELALTWDDAAERYTALYRRVLAGEGPGSVSVTGAEPPASVRSRRTRTPPRVRGWPW